MIPSKSAKLPESVFNIPFPPHHDELYPSFVDIAQKLGYLGFARDMDVFIALRGDPIIINESTAVNLWIYKLCNAFKQWDGTWYQDGWRFTETKHKKRILKDAILQLRGSQTMDVARYWTIKCNARGNQNLRGNIEILWGDYLQDIFPEEFAKATQYNLQFTMENWQLIMEDNNK